MNQHYQAFIALLFLFLSIKTDAQQTVGLFTEDPGSLAGYVLFAPLSSNTTYLIDKCGKQVHTWNSSHHPGQSVSLLPDGNLLRPGDANNFNFNAGGRGGFIEKFDWNSNLLWSYIISSSTECQHHEVKELPNGNILAICWETHTSSEAIAEGRNPATVDNILWSDKIVELQPVGNNQAIVVWEWHAWDHLIQDYDPYKANFGVVASHPELINLNFAASSGPQSTDWLHVNAVDYNADLDQVIVSCHNFSEFWIIDHSTTTVEAASHGGGVHGRGGDLLYRWGNPQAYERGTSSDQKLFGQHNPHWIENGLVDAGKIMIFNNGVNRPDGNYSTVDIITPPVDGSGNYSISGSAPYLPDSAEWHYQAPNPYEFYSMVISGAQRLSNGNTLIDEGVEGNFFEIDSDKNIVWNYVNPVGVTGPVSQGSLPFMGGAFRCILYEPSYSGFAGQTLIPGNPIELNPISYTCVMLTGISEINNCRDPIFTVANPFTENIILNPNQDVLNSTITLTDVTGRSLTLWRGVNFLKGQEVVLPTDLNFSPGIYFLTIKNSIEDFSAKLIHQQ